MQVGFIGLGQMGQAIASNLVRAGHRLIVWNRSTRPVEALVALGAEAAARPGEVAAAEVLMTMLADDATLRSVLIEQGTLERGRVGLIHVNLATISVEFARELASLHRARGLGYVAAPVFGRPEVARAAKLNVVVAGEPADLARVTPLLQAIGERIWPVGDEPARANVVKLAGNFMIASAIETMGEAAALTRAHGVESAQFLEILTSTLFAAPVFRTYGQLIAAQRYEPAAFRLALGLKDLRLALNAGDAAHVPMPLASLLRDRFLEAAACGDADLDWAAIARLSMRHAGLERAQPPPLEATPSPR
jgi:3-hydroxyisobutyrate dehydrogenase-like beta-hydroxyacid dehydrogenase